MTAAAPPVPPVPPAPARRGGILAVRRWTRLTKVGLSLLSVLVLGETAGFGAYHVAHRDIVTVVNAQVDGDKLQINAPVAGIVTGWRLAAGAAMEPDQQVGRIRPVGGFARPQQVVRAPGRGTVAFTNVVDGEWVNVGDPLATGYGPSGIYVTARVAEGDIDRVRLGQQVDIEAASGLRMHGMVAEKLSSSAAFDQVYPSPDQNTRNPQRIDQYIPVKIEFTDGGERVAVPGTNVTARIAVG